MDKQAWTDAFNAWAASIPRDRQVQLTEIFAAGWNAKAVEPSSVSPCPDAPAEATAKQQYEQFTVDGEDADPIERLRFFCSLAMKEQDWLDVEPFFDALTPPAEARELAQVLMGEVVCALPVSEDYLFVLRGVAPIDIGTKLYAALRGGRIDALLSGKERT